MKKMTATEAIAFLRRIPNPNQYNLTLQLNDSRQRVGIPGPLGQPGTASRAVNTVAATSYTLLAADNTKFLVLSHASSITLTVPDNATVALPVGFHITVIQGGDGAISVEGEDDAVVHFPADLTASANQKYATFELVQIAADVWVMDGHLVPD